MVYKFQYTDNVQREKIINDNTNLFLKEDSITLDGNFLTFADTSPLEDQLLDIKNNIDVIILKQEGIL